MRRLVVGSITGIMVEHAAEQLAEMADRIIVLKDGLLVDQGQPEQDPAGGVSPVIVEGGVRRIRGRRDAARERPRAGPRPVGSRRQ